MQSFKNTKAPSTKLGRFYRLAMVLVVALVAGGLGAAGCLDRPLCSVKKVDQAGNLEEDCRPRTTNLFVDSITNKSVDKIDLLFMIDNSSSMADKQAVLADAVPDLVRRLVSPNCVDANNVASTTPADPAANCPQAGATREFKPITNIHIGIVTSSLGGHGATTCEDLDPTKPNESLNDHAHLLGSRPRAVQTVYPAGTPGFLNWNPPTAGDVNQLNSQFQAMVVAAGQSGCGLEVQLESIYRFLADPFPPESIQLQPCRGNAQCAVPIGVDQTILAQRKAFLRGDSLVAVIMLTDENDCSVRDSDQYYYVASLDVFLPVASQACGANPNDPCCYSCGLAPPQGCAADPACGPPPPSLNSQTDPPNLRQIQQKRRFGIDFLYPIKRYVTALTSTRLCSTSVDLDPAGNCPDRPDKKPGLVANPLYQDLSNGGGIPRDPSLVFLAGIVGVPWQDVAVDETTPELHYKTANTMASDGTWDKILGAHNDDSGGDNNGGQPPVIASDPHMQESVDPRPGLPGPNQPANADKINGHEWSIQSRDDLQYACIFDKPTQTPCTDTTCDCFQRKPGENNPLCSTNGTTYDQNQYKAKAYPTLRELQLLKDFGKNAIVASICARNLTNKGAQDYGYRPAVDAIIDRLKEALTLKCLPRKLEVAADNTVPCSVIEATTNKAELNCASQPGRKPADAKLIEPARARLAADKACDSDPNTPPPECSAFGFCEIVQADDSCLQVTANAGTIGWCYVEPDPPTSRGDSSLVAKCQPNARQIIRFIGDNTPVRDGTVLIACLGKPVGGSTAGTGAPPPATGGDAAP